MHDNDGMYIVTVYILGTISNSVHGCNQCKSDIASGIIINTTRCWSFQFDQIFC